MPISLKASARGLEIVDQARKKKGWTKTNTSTWWLEAIAAQATLKRFWRRIPIEMETFMRICQVVGISNWQEIAEAQTLQMPIQDLVEAPDVSAFYGRIQEQDTLQQWITSERCRLLLLLGMGGIGKSALAATLVDTIQGEFEYLIWRCLTTSRFSSRRCANASTLRYAPPVGEILADLLRFLSRQENDLPDNVDALGAQLLSYLHKHRCLLILDDFDTVLKSGNLVGCYCQGYEAYGELIRRIGQERHQSCLLLTSTEKPREIASLEAETPYVRSLKLKGLDNENAKHILRDKGFSVEEDDWEEIIKIYKGNPLALKIVATTIQELFNGNVAEFLEEGTYIFGDIFTLLEQQFNRLSDLEKQIMYWLASNQEWVSLTELREQLVPPLSKRELIEALDSLQRRCLIDKATPTLIEKSTEIGIPFTLQPVIIKYLIKYAAR